MCYTGQLAERKKQLFWWDLEPSEFASVLHDQLSMRALCPTIDFKYVKRSFKIINRDRKTVVRLMIKSNVAIKDGREMELPEHVHVQGLRGYEKSFRKVVDLLPGEFIKPFDRYVEIVDAAYGVSDRQPLDYGAKFGVDLDHEISIGRAVAKICLNLTETMKVNRPGVVADIDSEFLHDFRIAIRRTRSLLSLLRKEMPTGQIEIFEKEFRWLGSATGPLRDIDVYLLKRDEYLGLLPGLLSEGLELFFKELQQRRITERDQLRRTLSSERYDNLIGNWCRFCSDPESELFSGIRQNSCRPLVSSIIRKRFLSFIKSGDLISDDSPDEKLHKLRIKGKKFRYLLEFFHAFYDASEVDLFLKHMKKLQDNLGDFNDLSVQVKMLENNLNALRGRNKQTVQLAASLGKFDHKIGSETQKYQEQVPQNVPGI